MVPASQPRSSTTRLPAVIRAELGLGDGSSTSEGGRNARQERAALFASRGRGRGRGRGTAMLGRKEARKGQRQEKKAARSQHHRQHNPARRSIDRHPSSEGVKSHQKPLFAQQAKKSFQDEHPKSIDKGKSNSEPRTLARHRAGLESSSIVGQKKHVKPDSRTPLERLLERTGDGKGATDKGEGPSAGKRARSAGEQQELPGKRSKREALSRSERNEEDEIAWLEAHLGARRSTAKSKSTKSVGEEDDDPDGDGLDNLLDDLDHFYPGMYEEQGDDDEEEEIKHRKGGGHATHDHDCSSEVEDQMEDDLGTDLESFEESLAREDDGASTSFDESEVGNESLSDDDESDEEQAHEASDRSQHSEDTESKNVETSGKYVPPSLRRQVSTGDQGSVLSAEEQKLRRAAKGLLNRLGDNNIEQVVSEIEALYRQYTRAQATTCLTSLVLDTISSGDNMGDTFIVLYAALVASLHRIVGVEFGAHLVQELVERFLRHYEAAREVEQEDLAVGKESRNLAALLASLYNLGVLACPLMYDIIRLLLGMQPGQSDRRVMGELDTDLLLKIVKLCGAQLRYDDPSSLKAIAHLAQEQQEQQIEAGSVSTRSKFMLESLNDLRNNRSRTTTANAGAEALTKMRKYLGGLSKKHTVRTQEPLRVGLEDLRNVDKRGKWWLVGAAWSGYDFSSKDDDPAYEPVKKAAKIENREEESSKMVELARQHGLNTATRQQIFVTLLSSQDYLDAVQRLLALTHKKATQRREVVRVLLHCLGREPTFNPYYVVVGSRLAREDGRGTQITMQYCLWDFLRRLGEKGVGGQSILSQEEADDGYDDDENQEATSSFGKMGESRSDNEVAYIARTYGWWMAKGAVGLDALRAVDFTALRRGRVFLQLLIIHLLLSVHVDSPVRTLTSSALTDSVQSRQAVEMVFVHGTRANQRVAQGLMVFFETHLKPKQCRTLAKELGAAERTVEALLYSRSVAFETVRVGARMAADNDGGMDVDL